MKKIALLVLLVCLLPVAAMGAESGTCGGGLTWELNDEGLLTVSFSGNGSGYMDDFVKWNRHQNDIKKIIINSGVKSIGVQAFNQCNNLSSVTIPGSVESIGQQAFTSCENLTAVNIGNGVKSIGHEAFSYCSGLTNVTIPGSVESIGMQAFNICENLTAVNIGNGVKSIGVQAFNQCNNLSSVTIPGSVESIGMHAFTFCKNLTAVNIGNGVKSIGQEAFSYCSGLTSVTIPGSMTSIGQMAFNNCRSLAEIWYSGTQSAWTGLITGNNTWDAYTPSSKKIHCVAASGTGAEGDPYVITDADHWDTLAHSVNDGTIASDRQHFMLNENITVTSMLGTSEHPFVGTFDGNGKTMKLNLDGENEMTAPFLEISGAIIKNLKVDGTVIGGNHSSGLVGAVKDSGNIIENCEIGVAVTATDQYCGGVLGHGRECATTIRGCVFSGSVTDATYAGIFWGWSDVGSSPVLKDCLDWSDSPYPIGLGSPDPKEAVSNCYYKAVEKETGISTRPWTNCGKPVHTVSVDQAVPLTFGEGTAYPVSGITAYPVGLSYDSIYRAGKDEIVPLTFPGLPDGVSVESLTASAGTLTGADGNWTLLMPDEDVVLTAKLSGAFTDADFRLPSALTTIGANAFERAAMTVAEVHDNCTSIGAEAFKDCESLTKIRIPAGVTSIAPTAFENCGTVYVYGTAGSKAQEYCRGRENCVFVEEK